MGDWHGVNFKTKGHISFNQGSTLPYVLELHRIDGLSKLKNNVELTLLFYDAAKCCCYGSAWKSSSLSPPFVINQDLVFHSEITASTILLLEIVQIDSNQKQSTVGWTCFKMFDKNLTKKKFDIYHGSLRAIFFLKEPSVATAQLLRNEGVTITLSLTQRSSVRGLTTHIPSNYFHHPAQLNKINKTVSPVTLFLEEVEVSFGAHIKKFEDYMLFLLMTDAKQQNTNIRQFDKVIIKERRLKASVHNGLNFTDQFQVVYLENVHNSSLKSKGVISLAGVDPRNHVIFSLEYVLEVPTSFTNLTLVSSMRQSQVHIVSLRWGVWSLNKHLPPSGSIFKVPITGGPGLNAENSLVFTSDFGPMNANKDAVVMFKLIKQEAEMLYQSTRDRLELTFQDTGVQPDGMERAPPKSVLTETVESFSIPTINAGMAPTQQKMATEPRPMEPLLGDNMAHFDVKPSVQQDIGVQDIEKAAYAQIHNAGFPDIVDCDGRPAIELDLSKHYIYSPALENNDPRTCNTVVFQFLAVSFNKTPIRNMFFTVQFYCYTVETTPILTAYQVKSNLPAILYKFQNSDQTPGCNVSFVVDPGTKANEPGQFLQHIQSGTCIIDMWNADSLFHEGSVTVKLKRLARQGEHGIQSSQVFNILNNGDSIGRLHLRIANIGSVATVHDIKDLTTSAVIDCVDNESSGELIVRPKPLSTVDQNLTSILSSQSAQKATRNRKIERMEAVRRQEDASYIIPRDENKTARAGQLTIVKNYRNKILNDVIRGALVANITIHHTLYSVYGTVTYFEVHFRNPNVTAPQEFFIGWDCHDIRLVYDMTECKALKSLFNVSTPLDPDVFDSSTQPVRFTLRPKEDIYIPFVYSSNATKEQFDYTMKITNTVNSPVQLIKLHFKQQRQIINERFMFYEAENSFAKHSLQAPSTRRPEDLSVRASNENVLCGVDEKGQVYFKAPVPKSTEMVSFLLLLYVDKNCYRPYQIWEIDLFSLKRVDMSAVVGSQKKFPVILRGTDSVRCVTCFSSHPSVIKVEPDREFMLLPSTIQEVKLLYEPTDTGSHNYMVNVVDTKNRVVVERWMVHTTASLPVVSKTYEIPLTTTVSATHKNISFSNPYNTSKTFKLKCNKPELVRFKEEELVVASKESVNIGLIMSPLALSHPNYILVFVNDVQQKCEECFALRIG
ncbi:hypothetical protein ACHWQZ_G007163 [Mnemiopsis leidyi]